MRVGDTGRRKTSCRSAGESHWATATYFHVKFISHRSVANVSLGDAPESSTLHAK